MSPTSHETEIKLLVRNCKTLAARLRRAGFRLRRQRTFEANTLLDDASASLRRQGRLLRLRQFGELSVLTYKGTGTTGKHKSREELELAVSSLDQMRLIFDRLGYFPTFRYEKFRTEWEDGAGLATIDETPIGNFLELEGEPDWIDRRAAELGYAEAEYITWSYGALYLDYCKSRSETPTHMVFSRTPNPVP